MTASRSPEDARRPPPTISRRRLLTTAGAGIAAGVSWPSAAWATAGATAPVTLTAGRRTLDIEGRAASVFGITQPDGTPGLTAEVGKPFDVTLRNAAGVDTLIHWHGLQPPYRQDGVPGVSGPAVAPGGTAHYAFPLDYAGTFWMHSHEGLQEQSLMSAPLIIRDPTHAADRQEVVMMLHDFSFTPAEEILAGLRGSGAPAMGMPAMGMSAMAMDLNDVTYDAFLAEDRTLADPLVVRVEPRGRVLLRVINAAASSNFHIDLGPVRARLVAVDGNPIEPVPGSLFPLAMAQRLDLELELAADQATVPVLAVLEGGRQRTGIVLATAGARVAKVSAQAELPGAPVDFQLEQQLRATAPLTTRSADVVHQVDLTGTMDGYSWGLNGLAYGQGRPLRVTIGNRVELVMTNRTAMSHPMHLHGHFFQVVAVDGARFAGAVRDTVLVPAQRSVTVAFDAVNPGRWAFHCHNLYHMASGMMTTVDYATG